MVSRIYALRQREESAGCRLAAAEPWRRSALYGIVNRYLRERTAGQILALNHELAVPTGDYTLQRYGPALTVDVDEYDLSRMALRVWYRGSVLLAGLSRDAGAEYYHFLQPNQYVPDSKPLTDRGTGVAMIPNMRQWASTGTVTRCCCGWAMNCGSKALTTTT